MTPDDDAYTAWVQSLREIVQHRTALDARVDEWVAEPDQDQSPLGWAQSATEMVTMLWSGWALTSEHTFTEMGGNTSFVFTDGDRIGMSVLPLRYTKNWDQSSRLVRINGARKTAKDAAWIGPSVPDLLGYLDRDKTRPAAVAIKTLLALEGNPDPDTVRFFLALGRYPTVADENAGFRVASIAKRLTDAQPPRPRNQP